MQSFIEVSKESHFPIQNLPFGVFSTADKPSPRVGVAIGQDIVDMSVLQESGLLSDVSGLGKGVFEQPSLNAFMGLGKTVWKATRRALQSLLLANEPRLRDDASLRQRVLVAQKDAKMHLPIAIGDYTDFYCSREHATNVGIMFRGKDNALQPNWLHIPVGYHGRASSVVPSGTPIRRPCGQRLPGKDQPPVFAKCAKLDYELEMGWVVGTGNELGTSISTAEAKDHIFGMVMLNDWSARDIQAWEYVPLGPFLGKNFGTTISNWIVTLDALEPFLVDGPAQEPTPLKYLQESGKTAYDINLEVSIKHSQASSFETIAKSNIKYMYWSITQQLAHHTVNGCNMRSGDLGGTGTLSGPTKESYGSLLELSWNGTQDVSLKDGTTRKFLEDGDTLNMTGYCESSEGWRIGFGECVGTILPAHN
ncbi:hypothetical protein VKS41_002406 [Umbelopsis sp. WA50703]